MANTYTPSAGTVAARVVAWLQARPSGEYNAAQISEALGLNPAAILSSLEQALAAKLVYCRQRDRTSLRAPRWYSATDRGEVQRKGGFGNCSTWMPPPKINRKDAEESGSSPGTPGASGTPEVSSASSAEAAAADAPSGDEGAAADADRAAAPAPDESAAQQGNLNPVTDAVEPAAPAALPPVVEQRREVDAQFAATLRAAMAQGDDDQLPPADLAATRRAVHAPPEPVPLAFRAARFTDGTLATERDGMVVAVYSAAEVDAIQKLLGPR